MLPKTDITAIVNIHPDLDAEILSLEREVIKLLEFSERRVITCQDDIKDATNDLTIMANLKKSLEEKRKEYVRPLNEYSAQIHNVFKTISDPLQKADKLTRNKVIAWQDEEDAKARKAQEAAVLKAQAAALEAEVRGDQPTGELEVIPDAPLAPPKTTFAEVGTASRKQNWKWELVDLSLVPQQYLMLNESLVGKVVRAGTREIPGIRIYPESGLQITGKKES